MHPVSPVAFDGAVDDGVARLWLSCLHTGLRGGRGAAVGDLVPPGPGWNYYSAEVLGPGRSGYRILLNAAARAVAASAAGDAPPLGPLTFVEVSCPGPFLAAGFSVPTTAQLGEVLRPEHLTALTPAQRGEVAYHRAERAGDLLFNWFD